MKYHEIISEKITKASQNPLNNPLFKKWFGNSKIVDKHGIPMVVYHGTASAFEEFEVASIGKVFGVDKHGFFFTNNTAEEMASGYAKHASQNYVNGERIYSGANVVPVFIKIERPYTFAEFMYAYEWGDATDENINKLLDGRSIVGWFDGHNDVLTQNAIDGGYDGIFLYDPDTDIGEGVPENIVVAFKPEQIKSIFAKEFKPNSAKLSEEDSEPHK